jgi:hypothetical protein
MRTLFLNKTMSLDRYVAGPNGELDWMTTTPDPQLTADIIALLGRTDEGFIGYPTAEGMIRYWAGVGRNPEASPGSPDIANAVAGMRAHYFRWSCRMRRSRPTRPVCFRIAPAEPDRRAPLHGRCGCLTVVEIGGCRL